MATIMIRKARQSDNLREIAECLFMTDPYIYPGAFGKDPQNAALALEALMSIENGLFSPENMVVAVNDNRICGVILFNRNGLGWNYPESLEKVREFIPCIEHFEFVAMHYFAEEACIPEAETIEIIACCVMPDFRNMGIGSKMLRWLIKQYPNYCMQLDVLASNLTAMKLYQNCGFEIDHSHLGFSLDERYRPECYRMVRDRRVAPDGSMQK